MIDESNVTNQLMVPCDGCSAWQVETTFDQFGLYCSACNTLRQFWSLKWILWIGTEVNDIARYARQMFADVIWERYRTRVCYGLLSKRFTPVAQRELIYEDRGLVILNP